MDEKTKKLNEKNLSKLAKSNIPLGFVKDHKGSWNHQQWLEFCSYLQEKGYTPIDYDRVGLLLEEKKKVYLAGCCKA